MNTITETLCKMGCEVDIVNGREPQSHSALACRISAAVALQTLQNDIYNLAEDRKPFALIEKLECGTSLLGV